MILQTPLAGHGSNPAAPPPLLPPVAWPPIAEAPAAAPALPPLELPALPCRPPAALPPLPKAPPPDAPAVLGAPPLFELPPWLELPLLPALPPLAAAPATFAPPRPLLPPLALLPPLELPASGVDPPLLGLGSGGDEEHAARSAATPRRGDQEALREERFMATSMMGRGEVPKRDCGLIAASIAQDASERRVLWSLRRQSRVTESRMGSAAKAALRHADERNSQTESSSCRHCTPWGFRVALSHGLLEAASV